MRDLLLQCSGLAAIAVALIHGVLGETKVFARATITPDPSGLAGRHRGLDRRRRAANRRAVDGLGAGTALDYRNAGMRIWLCRAG